MSMDLAGSGVPLYAMAWGLAALAAGAFRGKKRVWAAAAFAAAGVGLYAAIARRERKKEQAAHIDVVARSSVQEAPEVEERLAA